ncbi:tRNA (guanine6-N2)-methyltransferase [Catenulispora sp. GAS73]|uniref:methyltransferase n=1 Tax=Catenulispora sp. GAS73 TaxID=3156269 RepID=UPI003513164E
MELLFLPGLDEVVREEIADRLPDARHVSAVSGRDDSLKFSLRGSLAPLLGLRTVVAPFVVLRFPVPRPKSLSSPEYFPVITEAVQEVVRLNRTRPPVSFRIDAAGRDSPVMRAFADRVAHATGLRHDEEDGECVLRVRRAPDSDAWDVLVRLSTLPLSARPWRVEGYDAAVNATVAAAMIRLSRPRPGDRVANLMCGSGTILIERMLAGPAATAVGVDVFEPAVRAAEANAVAAGVAGRIELLVGDIMGSGWQEHGPFDCLYADPPWGDKSGRHSDNEQLHAALLDRAAAAARPGARLVVLTHEINIMERCLRRAADLWALESQTRVFQKGHHPRIGHVRAGGVWGGQRVILCCC